MLTSPPLTVGFILFDHCDLLDFAGPLEVLSNATSPPLSHPNMLPSSSPAPKPLFKTYIIAETVNVITTQKVVIRRDYDLWHLESCGIDFDILIVPGGYGARKEMMNGRTLQYIRSFVTGHDDGKRRQCLGCSDKERWLMSVCTGSMILASAGVLDGCEAATHHSMRQELKEAGKGKVQVAESGKRVVWSKEEKEGGTACHIVTAGGVSSGMDAALVLVAKLFGDETATKTAEWIEYKPSASVEALFGEQFHHVDLAVDAPDS